MLTAPLPSYFKSRPQADDSGATVSEHLGMNASDIRAHLTRLELERIEAPEVGLTGCKPYMADLEHEILICRHRRAAPGGARQRLALEGARGLRALSRSSA
jgi:hypothetical protein